VLAFVFGALPVEIGHARQSGTGGTSGFAG
jgi:hypothetical protein